MSDVEAAVRTLKVFEVFSREKRPLSLSVLATHIDIPVSSCLLLIRTLLRRGYLYQAASQGGYYPTKRMLEHAALIAEHDPILEQLQEMLTTLRDRTEETIALSKLQGVRAIYLAVFDSPQMVRPSVSAGALRPLHSTSMGKALLGGLSEADRKALLDEIEFPRFTTRTITSRARLEAEIEKSAAQGWYSNEGETVADLSAVSVPIHVGSEVYAISILGPSHRFIPKLDKHVKSLKKACAEWNAGGASASAQGRSKSQAGRRRAVMVEAEPEE